MRSAISFSGAGRLLVVLALHVATFEVARASTMVTEQFDFLAQAPARFWLLRRAGADAGCGAGILEIRIDADSVAIEYRETWNDSTIAPSAAGYFFDWESFGFARSQSRQLELPSYGWTITSPAPDSSRDARAVVPPEVRGVRTRLLYVEDCGKYANYGLRAAFVDLSSRTILVLTHSDADPHEVGYSGCTPGDGFLVLAISDDLARVVPLMPGAALVELTLDGSGKVTDVQVLSPGLSAEDRAAVEEQARRWPTGPLWWLYPHRIVMPMAAPRHR